MRQRDSMQTELREVLGRVDKLSIDLKAAQQVQQPETINGTTGEHKRLCWVSLGYLNLDLQNMTMSLDERCSQRFRTLALAKEACRHRTWCGVAGLGPVADQTDGP